MGLVPSSESAASSPGMAGHAVSGTGWSAFQGIVNKLATMASMLVVARFLSPEDYGASALVQGAGTFLVLLPPLVMGDVLIAHERHLDSVRLVARRLVFLSAGASSVVILLSLPVFLAIYPNFPGGTLTALMLTFAVRPLADAACVVPLSRLRACLRFRAIAAIDGGVQLAATVATVVMAASGAEALSLAMPQALASVARAVLYFTNSRDSPASTEPPVGRRASAWSRRLGKQFVTAALAQHSHTFISNLPMLALGHFSTKNETGTYTFAFYLSVQATFVISYQVGLVLQPIFVKLRHDPVRQSHGFLRVIAAVGALAVPLSLLQAVLAEPLLKVLFGERWLHAAPTFAALSIGQAFFFAVAPTMAMLRAQGRFRLLLTWQILQLVVSVGAYAVAAAHGALMVALVDSITWTIAVPIAAWTCVWGRGPSVTDVLRPVFAPWLTALPIAALAWYASWVLSEYGMPGAILAVVVVGPLAGAASLAAIRFSQPSTYAELAPLLGRAIGGASRFAVRMLTR